MLGWSDVGCAYGTGESPRASSRGIRGCAGCIGSRLMLGSPVSAVILVRNEAKGLADCLRSLDWADERLVIDAFSVDGSARIETDDVRVVERRFKDFADQREAALRLATHDWVFFVDADERVSDDLRDEI